MLKNITSSFVCEASKSCQIVSNSEQLLDQCEWNNYIFTNSIIRYGHIEYFRSLNDKVEVVHVVFWPTPYIDLPIYGFDVIALNGKVTGLFCDLTCGEKPDSLIYKLQELNSIYIAFKRPLPEWGEFFSKNFLILAPGEKLLDITNCCLDLFKDFLSFTINNLTLLDKQKARQRIEAHNNYSVNQRKNTKTQKALACYIGEENSIKFINEILFPIYN